MRKNRSALLLAALSVLLALTSPAFATSLITNGGFELTSTGGTASVPPGPPTYLPAPANPGSFYGWNAEYNDTNFELVEYSYPGQGWNVYDGNYAAQLGVAGPLNSTLGQTFSDTVGQKYALSFYLNGDSFLTNDFDASVGGVNMDLGDVTAPWKLYTIDFTGTGSDTVLFSFFDNGDYLSLDDVSVNTISAVPEPSSLLLLGTGVFGLAAIARLRRPVALPI